MTFRRIQFGKKGEERAAQFLQKRGYKIIEKNFRTGLGEIDIVAREGDTVCFVEVKTRSSDSFLTPLDAVSRSKQRKLSQLALIYLQKNNLLSAKARFDVVAVVEKEGGVSIEIVKNAFELTPPYMY